MKTIESDELFQNLNAFLKTKGLELKEGSYARRIRKGCTALTDLINATQKTVHRAKDKVDQNLDRLRQTIHNKTAPKPPTREPEPAPATPPAGSAPLAPQPNPTPAPAPAAADSTPAAPPVLRPRAPRAKAKAKTEAEAEAKAKAKGKAPARKPAKAPARRRSKA